MGVEMLMDQRNVFVEILYGFLRSALASYVYRKLMLPVAGAPSSGTGDNPAKIEIKRGIRPCRDGDMLGLLVWNISHRSHNMYVVFPGFKICENVLASGE